ncbi:MAG: D-alanine--D-alanine ligase [Nevskia sp.]|nr:D-alanine--D-alanine ligase [Nevskia sp.]
MRKLTTNPQDFGRVAVLMGGWSSEREVSLWSGLGVAAALQRRGVNAVAVDADRGIILNLRAQGFDRVFNILHGGAGEDGTVQAVLNLQAIPYTGSGVLASALGMDKLRSKRMWKAEGLPTPDWLWLRSDADALGAGDALGYPLFIKPSEEGSSVGVTKARGADALVAAYREATGANRLQPRAVLAERYIAGGEYTCAILDGQPLPLIRIEPTSEFYDYHAKYIANDTRYICPTDLVPPHEAELQALCLRAYELVGCRGWGRVDFMLDAQGNPWLIEVNTNPGMTSHSLVPMAAAACGMDYEALCWAILETTLEPAPNAAQEPTR